MGFIKLYSVLFKDSASVNQTVRVEYRVSSSVGLFTLVNNAAPVLANGNFSPEITISPLTDGETYTVKITNLCNGTVVTKDFKAGVNCTGYTLQANTGGARIAWEDCETGESLAEFYIEAGAQKFICSRSAYYVASGSVTVVSQVPCTS